MKHVSPHGHALDNAYCRGCGYKLYGLTGLTCPECGRAFDPADEKSYQIGAVSRKRIWTRRAVVALLIAATGSVFFPRSILRSNVTFTCNACGMQFSASYSEPKSPSWIAFRYPGRLTTAHTVATPEGVPKGVCSKHLFTINVGTDLYMGGQCQARFHTVEEGDDATMNGNLLTPRTVETVLRQLVSPSNNGVGP